jgi:RNA polymerase sigma-70 factor, ECF subfamily
MAGRSLEIWRPGLYRILMDTFTAANSAEQREPRQAAARDPAKREPTRLTTTAGAGLAEAAALERLPGSAVAAALQALSAESRILVYLADVEGFSYRQIAGITGIPAGALASGLHRARCLLRDQLAAHAGGRGQPGPGGMRENADATGPDGG